MKYTKVIIKSEADLPKEEDDYAVYYNDGRYRTAIFHNTESDKCYWLNNVDWYLIEDTEKSYPEEFVVWFKLSDYIRIIIDDEHYWFLESEIVMSTEPMKKYTFKQVYEYWLNEIKNKLYERKDT